MNLSAEGISRVGGTLVKESRESDCIPSIGALGAEKYAKSMCGNKLSLQTIELGCSHPHRAPLHEDVRGTGENSVRDRQRASHMFLVLLVKAKWPFIKWSL